MVGVLRTQLTSDLLFVKLMVFVTKLVFDLLKPVVPFYGVPCRQAMRNFGGMFRNYSSHRVVR
jgi:hypothetical protein